MKSLSTIIEKLSQNEIETFRLFLQSHSRSGSNKKLELFNTIVASDSGSSPSMGMDVSRQSVYQLKKRLQDDLYTFLMSHDQAKNCDDQLFLEMDCHKKLYCFKILLDKGIRDHAYQVLQEVLEVSLSRSLHTLYLEAVNLRNAYFPLRKSEIKRQVPINYQLKKLKKTISSSVFINHYITKSADACYEHDQSFRRVLIDELSRFDLQDNEQLIEGMIVANHLFFQRDFKAACNKLEELSQLQGENHEDDSIRALIYIDLTKASICLNDIAAASRWLAKAEDHAGNSATFAAMILELHYIIGVRSFDMKQLDSTIARSKSIGIIRESEILTTRWACYSLFKRFLQNEYREVIRSINGDAIFVIKNKGWLLNIKVLELLSIFHLEDFDWLFYKIDSLRKNFTGLEEKSPRLAQVIHLLRTQVSRKQMSPFEVEEKILEIENQFPWHPLGIEIVNYARYACPSSSTLHLDVNASPTPSLAEAKF